MTDENPEDLERSSFYDEMVDAFDAAKKATEEGTEDLANKHMQNALVLSNFSMTQSVLHQAVYTQINAEATEELVKLAKERLRLLRIDMDLEEYPRGENDVST